MYRFDLDSPSLILQLNTILFDILNIQQKLTKNANVLAMNSAVDQATYQPNSGSKARIPYTWAPAGMGKGGGHLPLEML